MLPLVDIRTLLTWWFCFHLHWFSLHATDFEPPRKSGAECPAVPPQHEATCLDVNQLVSCGAEWLFATSEKGTSESSQKPFPRRMAMSPWLNSGSTANMGSIKSQRALLSKYFNSTCGKHRRRPNPGAIHVVVQKIQCSEASNQVSTAQRAVVQWPDIVETFESKLTMVPARIHGELWRVVVSFGKQTHKTHRWGEVEEKWRPLDSEARAVHMKQLWKIAPQKRVPKWC